MRFLAIKNRLFRSFSRAVYQDPSSDIELEKLNNTESNALYHRRHSASNGPYCTVRLKLLYCTAQIFVLYVPYGSNLSNTVSYSSLRYRISYFSLVYLD